MIFDYKYMGHSRVESSNTASAMSFVPDFTRPKTFFSGVLNPLRAVAFREAISALHSVVVNDQRYQPRDNSEYKNWRAEKDREEVLQLFAQELGVSLDDAEKISQRDFSTVMRQVSELNTQKNELRLLQKQLENRLGGFYQGLNRYYSWLYTVNKDAWFVLDPVITVHPEDVFFECFSQDESSYGKLSCNYNVFSNINDFACGTTNIDYTSALYDEFQKIRSYKKTSFDIDPGGFSVATEHEDLYREVKVDLPNTWVRGFLQVSASMELSAHKIRLSPFDLHKICLFLRKNKEIVGPRALRFLLKAGEPPVIYFEPWNTKYVCKNSTYLGDDTCEIRVWGRRRIHILERLIPIADHFDLHLMGEGLPYFFIAQMGDMAFTLGLSSWSDNNFSTAAQFDLLAPRSEVSLRDKEKVFAALKKRWTGTVDDLRKDTKLSKNQVASALTAYMQAGKVVFDLNKERYQLRELSREALDPKQLVCASKKEEEARLLLERNQIGKCVEDTIVVQVERDDELKGLLPKDLHAIFQEQLEKTETHTVIEAPVETPNGVVQTKVVTDEDGRILLNKCFCTCSSFTGKHPCSHILALRMQQSIPSDERQVADIVFVPETNEGAPEEIETIDGTLGQIFQESRKRNPKKKSTSRKQRTESQKSPVEEPKKRTTAKKEKAPKETKKSKGSKGNRRQSGDSLAVIKEAIDYSSLVNQVVDKKKVTGILATLEEYKGSWAYSAILLLMLDELMCPSSVRQLIQGHLSSASTADVAEEEEISQEEQIEVVEEADLSSVKVIFVGRFAGFTKNELNKAAKKAGASVASTIGKANVVVKGTNIGASQKKQLKSFKGKTLDLDAWTKRLTDEQ